jgi:hypothetical protein
MIMPWYKWFKDLFDIENVQEVLLVGTLPDGGVFDSMMIEADASSRLSVSAGLDSYLRNSKPRVLVTLVGLGTAKGFLVPDSIDTLPGNWWKLDTYEVGLFSYCCYSFEYLNSSDIMRSFTGALCYESELWFSLGDDDFWVTFVGRLRELLRKAERVGNDAYANFQMEYSRAIRERRGGGETYLTRLALVSQSQRLRLIRGKIL